MKCVVNWIRLRMRVRSRNTQPQLKNLAHNDNYKYVLILMYPVTESCSFFQLNHILQIVLFF